MFTSTSSATATEDNWWLRERPSVLNLSTSLQMDPFPFSSFFPDKGSTLIFHPDVME
uniref:Cactin n=1 Tax=Rhizophora mucronata TaxID=61149 RepID=A0A2P2K943_RHIMU